jgi:hypothetical protein
MWEEAVTQWKHLLVVLHHQGRTGCMYSSKQASNMLLIAALLHSTKYTSIVHD